MLPSPRPDAAGIPIGLAMENHAARSAGRSLTGTSFAMSPANPPSGPWRRERQSSNRETWRLPEWLALDEGQPTQPHQDRAGNRQGSASLFLEPKVLLLLVLVLVLVGVADFLRRLSSSYCFCWNSTHFAPAFLKICGDFQAPNLRENSRLRRLLREFYRRKAAFRGSFSSVLKSIRAGQKCSDHHQEAGRPACRSDRARSHKRPLFRDPGR